MELREIGIDDVYPDEKNPRKDFGDIAALAESCMLNALNPGEPVNPIVVVEDGGIYRIVDGERRYKAMCKNKLARCHAVVCDDMDEANAMVAMVATDDKRPLTDVERSRGVQQMLLLGVDPERVERAGRMPKGAAAKLRRARAAVDDAGDDMTLDRMLAIAEFEELGDGAAVEKLTSCREEEWRDVAKAERQRMQRDERRAAQLAVEIVENARVEAPDALALERALHDWLCENVDYTNGEMTVPDVPRFCGALGALLDGEANCQGYSDAFYLLAGLAGFEVRHQNGTDASGAAHTWNVIRLNGKWYIVDVTHDDVESSNTWHYKAFNAGLDLIDHTWPEEGSIAEIEAATDPSLNEYLANGRAFDSLSALAEAAILARQNGGARIYRVMLQGQTADWEALSDQILEAANARGISCSWQIYASAQAGNTYYSVEWTEWE